MISFQTSSVKHVHLVSHCIVVHVQSNVIVWEKFSHFSTNQK